MPVRKDGRGKRWVEMEILVPGTPEQVWDAMATGPGNAAWFSRMEIGEEVGGKFAVDFGGGMTTSGEVTAWEKPNVFAYVERGWAEGAPPVATEITIAARDGGRCIVRMVHSLFASTDDWDDQLEGFESGWPGFFDVLRLYLAGFAGQQADCFMAMAPAADDALSAWRRLLDSLGLSAPNSGERREGGAGPEPLSGVVVRVHQDMTQRYVLMRLEGAAPGALLAGTYDKDGGAHVSLCRYVYGADAESRAAALEPRWRGWLETAMA